jgi:hypothetical protein
LLVLVNDFRGVFTTEESTLHRGFITGYREVVYKICCRSFHNLPKMDQGYFTIVIHLGKMFRPKEF